MSEEGRLALSGPDVIETVAGVEEFDARIAPRVARDRWQASAASRRLRCARGGRRIAAFRAATAEAVAAVARAPAGRVARAARRARARAPLRGMRDGLDVWRAMGAPTPWDIPMLTAEDAMRLASTVAARGERARVPRRTLFPLGRRVARSSRRRAWGSRASVVAPRVGRRHRATPPAVDATLARSRWRRHPGAMEGAPCPRLPRRHERPGAAASRGTESASTRISRTSRATVDVARRAAFRSVSIVYGAGRERRIFEPRPHGHDRAYALADAQIRVMDLHAMGA